jgi:hypothetical protein
LSHILTRSQLFEGLFNDRIDLTTEEWKALIENELEGPTPEAQLMRALARVPEIMRRGRNTFEGEYEHTELRDGIGSLYETSKVSLGELQKQWATTEEPDASSHILVVRLHAHYQRMYGLGLVIVIILNCVLSALDTEDDDLIVESTFYATEILGLAADANRYRPLGAGYITLCLMAAWAGTNDELLRMSIGIAMKDYQDDFYKDTPIKDMDAELDSLTRRIRLLTPESHSNISGRGSDTSV